MPDPRATGLLPAGLSIALHRLRHGLEALEPLSLLVVRLAIANVFWRSAMTKVADMDKTVDLFRDIYAVPVLPPELAAWLATAVELGGAIALALGLFARLGALGLLGITATIQFFVFPENWPEHLVWTGLLLTVLVRGPGAISLDRFVGPLLIGR
ncbi:DoxX family protein [Zavarzinia sp. CC-PAN008]|uniref:DoxX family protein n=1 Tax=Zavarzinia sp. CC-PAN008 TaxID=3243332 RepID=UPI003F74A2DD